MKTVWKIGKTAVKAYLLWNTAVIYFCYMSTLWKRVSESHEDESKVTVGQVFNESLDIAMEDANFGVNFLKKSVD